MNNCKRYLKNYGKENKELNVYFSIGKRGNKKGKKYRARTVITLTKDSLLSGAWLVLVTAMISNAR